MKWLTNFWIVLVIFYCDKSEATNNIENAFLMDSIDSVGGSFFQRAAEQSNNSECKAHMEAIGSGILNKQMWAMEMVDAWGKIPSGILMAQPASLGNYDECVAISAEPEGLTKLQGKYCLGTIPLSPLLKDFIPGMNLPLFDVKLGVCIPSSCSADWFNTVLIDTLQTYLNLTINSTLLTDSTCSIDAKIEFRAIDWAAIVIFSLFGLMLIVSTVYDYFIRTKGGRANAFLITFSALSNGEKIFQMRRSASPNVIECLHGIRSLSIIWVVFGHTYGTAAGLMNTNTIYILDWLSSPFSMFVQSATVSVDSFFLMSGLLISWMSLAQLKRSGSLNILMMYFHRYIRLTPVLAAVIFFVVSLAKYTGSGPFWNNLDALVAPCEKSWWSTLLYVQNYVDKENMCLGHTWYLACDTQMFLIAPFLVLGLWKWGWKVMIGIVVLMALSIGCTFAIFMKHDFAILMINDFITRAPRMQLIYYPTHTRLAPWLLGIILGYCLFQIKNVEVKMSKHIVIIGWISSLTIIGAVLFGVYPKAQPNATSTTLEGAFYESFSRVSWAAALSWIIFACHKGYGGPINEFLSFSFWQPISRLSYCLYLVHYPMQAIFAGQTRVQTHFSDFDAICRFWGDFSISFLVSIVVALAFESPIVGLEKMLLPQRKEPEQSKPDSSAPILKSESTNI